MEAGLVPGDSVRVTSGPLADLTAEVIEIDESERSIKVTVEVLERRVPVELDLDQVEKL